MSAHQTDAAAGPAATAGAAAYPRRWLAAVVMIGAALMDMIDITVVNVALPTIRSDLGASGTQLEWVVSAYMLAFAAVLLAAALVAVAYPLLEGRSLGWPSWAWLLLAAGTGAIQLGVAVIGTIFFGQLGTHSFTRAFTHGLPVTAGLFLASAALSLLLPKTAVADEYG